MSNQIRSEVYKRIVLAKVLHRAGESACSCRNDQMAFTKGILLLHDAAEAGLGAVADHLHAKLTSDCYLLKYYNLIDDVDQQNRKVPYSNQMRNLNTLRNNAKHQGILPDPKSNAHFPTTVYALLDEICQTYLELDFSSVSLKSLIRNETVLSHINRAEKAMEEEKIEIALIELAYAMYHICETSTLPFLFSILYSKKETETELQFTRPYQLSHKVELIEYGVDVYLYYKFKNLTPKIARKPGTGKLYYWWDKDYGHPANWTLRNAQFCLNFCIETALKFQREEDEGYRLIHYSEVFEDVIEPAGEEARIWDQSSHPLKFPFPKPSEPRKQILSLKKGQSIIGFASDMEETLDEWFIISDDIPTELKKGLGFGYVLKSEVNVRRRERKAPSS